MNSKKLLLGLALFIQMLCSTNVSAQEKLQEIYIYRYSNIDVSVTKGNVPNRAPAKIPINAWMSQDGNIYIYGETDLRIEYHICDENNITLLSGTCECTGSSHSTINLIGVTTGIHTLYLIVNNNIYKGYHYCPRKSFNNLLKLL